MLGHEVMHGFDENGHRLDEHGVTERWWSTEENRRYEEKAKCFIEQYEDFKVTKCFLNQREHF